MNPAACLESVRVLWADILEVPLTKVGADSHFLELGGDSLHWMRMASRLENLSGMPVPGTLQLAWATPARCVARWLATSDSTEATAGESGAAPVDCFPATPMQRGIWFAQQLAGDAALYAGHVVLHFTGPLEPERLQVALHRLVAEVPVLKARLQLDADTSRLMVHCDGEWSTAVLAVSRPVQLSPGALPAALASAGQDADVGDACPPFRARLFQSSAQHFHLWLQLHHLVSDGWSGSLLVARLAALYHADATATPYDEDLAFAAYAWRLARQAETSQARLAFWRKRLDGYADAQRGLFGQVQDTHWPYRVRTQLCHLPSELRAACERSARETGVTSFVLCQLACKLALARLLGEPRQVLAIPRAQREAHEERAIGCFVTLQLSVSYLPEGANLQALLREEASRYEEECRLAEPLDSLSAALAPQRLPDGNPWSTVLMAYQNYPQQQANWNAVTCRLERLDSCSSQYALSLEFTPGGDAWELRVSFADALFDAPWLERFLSCLRAMLQQLAN